MQNLIVKYLVLYVLHALVLHLLGNIKALGDSDTVTPTYYRWVLTIDGYSL